MAKSASAAALPVVVFGGTFEEAQARLFDALDPEARR
jgi:hypothetical protein